MTVRAKIAAAATLAFGAVTGFSACGTQGIQVPKSSPYYNGAVLFLDHCSGCHSLSVVGASGSATSIASRVKTQAPNFNQRKEEYNQIIYAIENGGFSGAIMPENLVVGHQAQEVAAFLAKYSGLKAQVVPSVTIPPGSSGITGPTGAS